MNEVYEGWAILELMGHRRLAGKVSQAEMYGAAFCRIDVPDGDGFTTQYYGGSSIYALTPCAEDTARRASVLSRPAPVHAWELPPQLPGATSQRDDTEEEDEPDDEDLRL